MLFQLGIPYEYEQVCDGTAAPGRLRPDFSFVTDDGDLIVWEHLGMLSRPDYKRGWDWKREWYQVNGFSEGSTLFTSTEDSETGLNCPKTEGDRKRYQGLIGLVRPRSSNCSKTLDNADDGSDCTSASVRSSFGPME